MSRPRRKSQLLFFVMKAQGWLHFFNSRSGLKGGSSYQRHPIRNSAQRPSGKIGLCFHFLFQTFEKIFKKITSPDFFSLFSNIREDLQKNNHARTFFKHSRQSVKKYSPDFVFTFFKLWIFLVEINYYYLLNISLSMNEVHMSHYVLFLLSPIAIDWTKGVFMKNGGKCKYYGFCCRFCDWLLIQSIWKILSVLLKYVRKFCRSC